IEIIVEIECLLHVLRVLVGKLHARFLPPEQIRHQADEAGFGEFVRMMAHRVVDAPDFHDGDDGADGCLVGDRQIGSHLAVAQLDLNVLRFHTPAFAFAFNLSKSRALPARIRSRAALSISSASIASMVLRISPPPPSASNGASVANNENFVPKKSCPQRVAARAPLSAVSAYNILK